MIREDITSLENLRLVMTEILQTVPPDAVFSLHGHPGAGKTTLVKTAAAILNVAETVQSPTFNILNVYSGMYFNKFKIAVYHFDFYRLTSEDQLLDLAFHEASDKLPYYAFMEWPERVDIRKILPDIEVYALTIETEYSHQLNEVSKRTLKYEI